MLHRAVHWEKTTGEGTYTAIRFRGPPLNLTDCHSERDFDRKSSSAQCEGRKWTLLNAGYRDTLVEPVTCVGMQRSLVFR